MSGLDFPAFDGGQRCIEDRESGIELTLPLAKGFGISGHTYVFNRDSRYSDAPRDKRDYHEARILLVWTKAGFK